MTIGIDASTTLDSVLVDDLVSTTGTVEVDIERATGQYPLHIVFCIDTSGSMNSDISTSGISGVIKELSGGGGDTRKIDVAKEGLVKASRQLSSDDSFAVVSFSGSSSTAVSPTMGNRARRVKSDITSLSPGGGTNIKSGLKQSRRLLDQMSNERAIEWVVLISDGRGKAPSGRRVNRKFAGDGITIHSAGVGNDYDENTLRELAHQTQGEQRHIQSGDQLQTFFQEKVSDAGDVVALDPSLTLTPSDVTTIDEVYYTLGEQQSSVDPDWQGGTCHIDMADINENKPPTVKFDMEVEPDTPDLAATLVEANLQTQQAMATDEIAVEVGTAHTLETVDEPAVDEEFLLRQITDEAMNEGVEAARRKYREHEDDLSAEARQEVESTLQTMERDRKSGTDEFSTLPSKIDD